jgi:poly(A) polymerase/tRNA nucleotidyltransferase (CCA-adding enzyme)
MAVLTVLPEARLVGGVVRDVLAGRAPTDVDLTTPQPPDAVMRMLQRAGIRAVPTGIDHGTVTAVVEGRGFEVTTLRRDVETDGRHALVAFTDDWRADAARRDFTINAMSATRDGAVFDYFGGVADLQAGIVRFVGDPATRIAEDYLRILRFFRFLARYGGALPDLAALGAIRAGLPGLAQLSAERVWRELTSILAAPDPRGAERPPIRCCGWRHCWRATRQRSASGCGCPPRNRKGWSLCGLPRCHGRRWTTRHCGACWPTPSPPSWSIARGWLTSRSSAVGRRRSWPKAGRPRARPSRG